MGRHLQERDPTVYQEAYDDSVRYLTGATTPEWNGWLQATADVARAKQTPGLAEVIAAIDRVLRRDR